MRQLKRLRHELWWLAEVLAGDLWHRACKDGVTCWLDWLPAYCTRRRYAAQNALHPRTRTQPAPKG